MGCSLELERSGRGERGGGRREEPALMGTPGAIETGCKSFVSLAAMHDSQPALQSNQKKNLNSECLAPERSPWRHSPIKPSTRACCLAVGRPFSHLGSDCEDSDNLGHDRIRHWNPDPPTREAKYHCSTSTTSHVHRTVPRISSAMEPGFFGGGAGRSG